MHSRCPVCGAPIQPEMVPPLRTISFECSACRNQLQVVTPDRNVTFIMSAIASIPICLFLRIHGFALMLAIIALTLILFALGSFLLSVIGTPRLERSRPKVKPLHLPTKIRAAH